MGLTTKEISSSSFNDMISSVDRRSEYVENRAGANVRLNNFLTPYTLDDKSSILNAPCGYSNGVYASLRPVQTLGSELVTNGDFATDTDWSLSEGATISNGQLNLPNNLAAFQTGIPLNTEVKFIVQGSGTVGYRLGTGIGYTQITLPKTIYTTTHSVGGRVQFYNTSGSDVTINSVSIKEVIDADFDFTRGSAATRVTKDGLIKNVQILSDDLVQNGDFEQIGSELVNNNNWTNLTSGTATVTDGVITFVNGTGYLTQQIISANTFYKFSVTFSDVSQGEVRFTTEGGVNSETISTNGLHEFYLKSTSAGALFLIAQSNFSGSIDNVSVKEVGQNWVFGTGWSIEDDNDNQVVKFIGSAANEYFRQNDVYTPGDKIRLQFTLSNFTSGQFRAISTGVVWNTPTINATNGTFTYDIDTTGVNNGDIYFQAVGGSFNGYLDNVSIIKITDDTDLPRIDYTNGTGSLLLEPQSTNKVTYSEEFSQWNTNEVTTQTGFLAPDGSNNAIKITSTGSQSYFVLSGLSLTGTDTRTIYARTVSGTGTANLCSYGQNTNNNFTITPQWQRFEVNGTTTATGEPNFYGVDFRFSEANPLTEVIIWGAQAEALSYATSYIPTSGSTVTRNADVCNNAGNSDLINSTEGVLYAEILPYSQDSRISLNDGTIDNNVRFTYQASNNTIFGIVYNGSNQAVLTYQLPTENSFYKIAFKYKASDFSLFVNGIEVDTQIGSGTTFISGTLSELDFDAGNGLVPFYGNVRSVAVFKEALTDEELAKITSTTQQEVFYEMRDKMLQINADYYEFGDYTTRLKKLF